MMSTGYNPAVDAHLGSLRHELGVVGMAMSRGSRSRTHWLSHAGYLPGVTPRTIDPTSPRLASGSWWFRSADGRLTLWQLPNPALCVWMVTVVLGWFELSARHAAVVNGVRHGALLVWALDEVVRGASPFRRTLGAVILVAQVTSLVRG